MLASKVLLSFPKVNLISILAGTLALISVFLPWWGVDGSAFGFTASIQWSLWGEPYLGDNSSSATLAQAARVMGLLNILVMAVVLITALLHFWEASRVPKNTWQQGSSPRSPRLSCTQEQLVIPSLAHVGVHLLASLDQSGQRS